MVVMLCLILRGLCLDTWGVAGSLRAIAVARIALRTPEQLNQAKLDLRVSVAERDELL